MAGKIQGIQLEDAPLGISTTKVNDQAITSAKVDGSVMSTDITHLAPGSDYTALGKKLINLADGTIASDAVNYGQLQAIAQGMSWKAACETGTIDASGNPQALPNAPTFAGAPGVGGTLTATANAALVVGGVNVTKVGQRVLVTSFSGPIDGPKNGIYELTQAGSAGPVPPAQPWILTRVADMDVTAEVPRATTTIDNPASFAFGKVYTVSSPLYPPGAFVLNTGIITWASMPLPTTLTAGLGISISGLTISVDITPTPDAAGRGLTFVANKLAADIEPNKGLKFDDTTGRFEAYLAVTPSVEGGLQFGANGGLASKLETASGTGGGLQIGPNGGIEVKADPAGAIKYTVNGIAISTKTAVAISSTGGLQINNVNELEAKVDPNKGLQISATNAIETKLENSTPTDGGLQFGPNGGIEAKLSPTSPTVGSSGGLAYSATGLLVNGDVLSTIANNAAPANDYSALGKQLKQLADGTAPTDAVTLQQLQGVVQGLDWKDNVVTATDAALPAFTWSAPGGGTLTANANNALAIGGIPVTAGMRVLVKDEVGGNAPYNGIYTVTQPGDNLNPYILVRSVDANTSAKVTNGLATTVSDPASTTFGLVYVLTTPDPIVLNTTNLTFSSIPLPAGYTAGNGIDISGLIISVLLGNSNPAIEFQGNTGIGLKTGNPANSAPGITRSAAGAYVDVNNKKQWSQGVVSTGAGTAVTADTLAATPWRGNGGDAIVTATLNGVEYEVANGGTVAAATLFLSPDGVIVRTWQNMQIGDGLYRGGALGFDTNTSFRVSMQYLASIP